MHLGGADALRVRRTLPSLRHSLVGAWCFADHYGPEQGVCLDVPPHPHTGLQTVSWLFDGEIEHRDSVFQHHVPDVVAERGVRAKVLIGSLSGATSPVRTQTPLLGAEVILDPDMTWELDVDPGFEHGVLVDTGQVDFDGVRLDRTVLGVRDAGLGHFRLSNPTDSPARVMLLGGEPFDEGVVMWWNFIGRSHEDIIRLCQEWNDAPDDRFGRVAGYRGTIPRLTAPPLPDDLRLQRRFRRGRQ